MLCPSTAPTPSPLSPLLTAKLPLVTALCGGSVTVDTLDGRRLSIPLPAPMTSRATKRVAGEGMPISKEPGRRGDLVVDFEVALPRLDDAQKAQLSKILPAE